MGAVSGAVLEAGGDVTGVVPYAMAAAGGEVDQTQGNRLPPIQLKEKGREKVRAAILVRRLCVVITSRALSQVEVVSVLDCVGWMITDGWNSHAGRRELYARAQSGDGKTLLWVHWAARGLRDIRGGTRGRLLVPGRDPPQT